MKYEEKYKVAMQVEQNAILQELKALHLRMEHQTVWDERIRKGIIKYLSWIKDRDGSYMPNNTPFDDMIAWLEKQRTSYTKRDVDDAFVEGMAFAKDELEKQGQKPAEWSEEDERMCQNILECLRNGWRKLPTDILKYESWLKSIKSQKQWKPSEEQISALDFAIDCTVYPEFQDKSKVLIELLEQLKQL